jgi:hypothetical protein
MKPKHMPEQEFELLTSEEIINRALKQVERDLNQGTWILIALGAIVYAVIRWFC